LLCRGRLTEPLTYHRTRDVETHSCAFKNWDLIPIKLFELKT